MQQLLESGTNKQIVIKLDSGTRITGAIQEGTASFSHIICSDKDLKFQANASQFQCVINDIDDIAGEHIKVSWAFSGVVDGSIRIYDIAIFDGYVETAEIQPDRASRKITAYDVLKKAQDIDITEWWRQQFGPIQASEYKGTYSTSADYSYGDVVLYDGTYYRWLVKSTDYVMVGSTPTLASEAIKGKTMATILASSSLSTYVQSLSNYDPYSYPTTRKVSSLFSELAVLLGTSTEGTGGCCADLVVKYNKVDKMTASDLLTYIAQVSAAPVCVNPETGKLYVAELGSETVDYSNNYEALNSKYAEFTARSIDRVKIYTTKGELISEYGSGENEYVVQNPLITDFATSGANGIYNIVSALSYTPAEVSAIVSFPIKPGAKITVTTETGETFETYALQNTISGLQMINQKITSQGQKTRDAVQPSISSEYADAIDDAQTAAQRAQAEAYNAEANAMAEIGKTAGLHTTKVTAEGGGYIYYLHNATTLLESDVRIEFSAEAIRFSVDGGQTWTTELKLDGETITQILSATGINAEWIKSGLLEAMELKGTTGEIGGWTINKHSLMTEVLTKIHNYGYKIVFKAPWRALYSKTDVRYSSWYVDSLNVDDETGLITFISNGGGSNAESITIDIKDMAAFDRYGITIRTNYDKGDAKLKLPLTYTFSDGSTYTVSWNLAESSAGGWLHRILTLSASSKAKIADATGGSAKLQFFFPSAESGTEYTINIEEFKVDDEDTIIFDPDPIEGISTETVMAIIKTDTNETVYELKSNGQVNFKSGTFGDNFLLLGDNNLKTIPESDDGTYIDLQRDKVSFKGAKKNTTTRYNSANVYNEEGVFKIDGVDTIDASGAFIKQAVSSPETGALRYNIYKQGNVCFFSCTFSEQTLVDANSSQTMADSLPSDCLPRISLSFPISCEYASGTKVFCHCQISTSGVITITNNNSQKIQKAVISTCWICQ